MAEPIRRRRRSSLLLAGLALLAAVAFFAAHRTGASASTTLASYPALTSGAPAGVRFLTAYHDATPGEATGPAYPAVAPAPNWPVSSSIRKVSVSVPGVSVWIAKSAEGGVCVLKYVEGNIGMGAVCGKPEAEQLAKGVSSATPMPSGAVVYAGVVPNGVSTVQETMPDGSVVKVPVTGNAWAHEYTPASATAARRHHARKGHTR